MTTQILEIDSLRKTYGKGNNQTKALNGITFQVMAGEFLGIMGSSGSGKSTLLNCIATVIRPTGGRIRMRETDVHSLRGADLAEYRGRKSAICSRALSCWTISPDGKTFCCRCRCTVSRQRKAGSACSHFRTIWKLRMCWISSRRRCPAANNSALPQRGR